MSRLPLFGLLALALGLAAVARAQDAGAGEDATADAAAATDAALAEDAAADAALAADATPAMDAATAPDAGAAGDGAVEADGAVAEDAAVPDAAAGCGEVTFQGMCQGDLVVFCYDGQLMQEDCSAAGRTCGLVDCTDADCYGHACVAPAGQPCGVIPCDIALGHGCLGGVCAPSTPCAADSFAGSCVSEAVITKCFAYSYNATTGAHAEGVVWEHDCSEAGTEPYVCGARSDGSDWCLGQEEANCDPAQGYECVAGLECIGRVCVAGGDDGGTPEVDAGPAADAAGSPDAEEIDDGEGDGCGCSAAATLPPAALLCAAVLGAAIGRRRVHPRRGRRGRAGPRGA